MPSPANTGISNDILSLVTPEMNNRWNLSADVGTPVVVTFNFPTSAPEYAPDIPGFAALGATQQGHARTALQTWAEASGIALIEVPGTETAEITLSFRDMAGMTTPGGEQIAGFAYYPFFATIDGVTFVQQDTLGGDVFLNAGMFADNAASLAPGASGHSVLLHELGHALGLEHPFDGEVTIDPAHDNEFYTLMSYDRSAAATDLGLLDIEATRLLYGPDIAVTAYWDAALGALRQTARNGGDILFGHTVNDHLTGSDGNDEFHNVQGGDTVAGGAGDDLVFIPLFDFDPQVTVTENGIEIALEDGVAVFDDVEVFRFINQTFTLTELVGPGETLTGTEGDDTLIGTDLGDRIDGAGGNDDLAGGLFADTLYGGTGNDTLRGDAGSDVLYGEEGNDALSGGDGADALDGGEGDDNLAGGAGADTIVGGPGDDRIGGGADADLIGSGDGNDIIGAGQGDDLAAGGVGNDIVNGGSGDDTLLGDDGNDTMGAGFGDDSVVGGAGEDNMGGGTGKDFMAGNAGNDSLGGGEGDDTVNGGAGDDFIAGGGRDDLLDGGAGDDVLNAGSGNDTLTGGAGADLFIFNQLASGEVNQITDFEDGQDLIRLSVPGVGPSNAFAALTFNATSLDGVSGVAVSVAGHTINVLGIDLAGLGVEDFIFI